MNETPAFSVIIPTYNRGQLISRAVDSVLNQTFKDFELIIVDDGSEDDTRKIIEEYIEKDDRIQYFYKKNGGQNSALNVGLRHAKGTYVAFLDSDDRWLKKKLEKVFDKFQTDIEIGVVYHRTGFVNKGKLQTINEDYLEGYIYKEVLEQEFLSSPTSFAAKRECFTQLGGYDETFLRFQDDDMCFLLAKNYKIGVVKEVLGVLGGEANDRVSDNPVKTANYYVILINKYKKDILEVCGKQKLADMYYKAAMNYSYILSREKTKKMFSLMKKYDVEGRYKKCIFSFLFWKGVVQSRYKALKSKVYKVYKRCQKGCFRMGVI